MNAVKNLVLASGLATGLLMGSASAALAGNHYAAVDIRNPTNNLLHYEFRWGKTGEWQSFTVEPDAVRTHWFEYSYTDQDSSPTPEVRFHYNPAESVPDFKVYDLEAYAVPDREIGNGMPYSFRYSPDGGYLDLYKQ
jgi:hypothetical protein